MWLKSEIKMLMKQNVNNDVIDTSAYCRFNVKTFMDSIIRDCLCFYIPLHLTKTDEFQCEKSTVSQKHYHLTKILFRCMRKIKRIRKFLYHSKENTYEVQI